MGWFKMRPNWLEVDGVETVLYSWDRNDLKQMCPQKVQDLQESGHISPESVPTEARNKYLDMQ